MVSLIAALITEVFIPSFDLCKKYIKHGLNVIAESYCGGCCYASDISQLTLRISTD